MLVFFFTDIEGSTQKWEKYKDEMKKALSLHDEILQKNIKKYGGKIIKHTGDGFFAVFEKKEPLKCALEIQRHIAREDWRAVGGLRIRIALHIGEAEKRGEDYYGSEVNRTARILATGWGGQILLTPEVADSCVIPDGATLKDLGVHLLKDLGEPQQIYGLIAPDLPLKVFPPLRSLSEHPNNLPSQPTPFIGRDKELLEIAELLQRQNCRLLTLVGSGGIGKTRLAIQAAAENIEKFPNGVYYVPLAPLSSPEFIISAIADALRFSFYSNEDPKNQLFNYLQEKKILIVMDNFEHLMEGVGLVSEIISKTSQVKVLSTSRERLNLKGEWILEIQGMEVPEDKEMDKIEKFSSVQLFLQSAQRIKPEFFVSQENRPALIRICGLLEGIPLGIELASTWVRLLSCSEIVTEIEKNQDFLSTSLRDIPERHRSLRAVFEYSWNLLSREERKAFRRLSVFHGGFDKSAGEKITGTSLSLFSALVDKSLLRRTSSGRYDMLEVLRQYAEEKLSENKKEKVEVKKRHCRYYAEFLHKREKFLKGEGQKSALKEINKEIENIREGWKWGTENLYENEIHRYIESLYLFYEIQGWFHEGQEVFGKAVEKYKRGKMKDKILGMLLAREGAFFHRLGQSSKARELLQKGLSILHNFDIPEEIAFSLNHSGIACYLLGEYKEARKLYQESLSICKKIGDMNGIARALTNMGTVAHAQGNYKEAKQLFQESLSICKELGDKRGAAISLNNLGISVRMFGEYSEAKQLFLEGLSICKEIGNRKETALCLNNLGSISHMLGDYIEAKGFYQECLEIYREIGDQRGIALANNNLGIIDRMLGEYISAKNLFQKSLRIFKETGDRKGISLSLNNLGIVSSHLGNYKEARELHKESLKISKEIGDRRNMLIALRNLGDVTRELKEYRESKEYFQKALKIAWNINNIPLVLNILLGISDLLAQEGKGEKALRLVECIFNHPASERETRNKAEELRSNLKTQLSPEVVKTAIEEGKKGKLEELVKEIC